MALEGMKGSPPPRCLGMGGGARAGGGLAAVRWGERLVDELLQAITGHTVEPGERGGGRKWARGTCKGAPGPHQTVTIITLFEKNANRNIYPIHNSSDYSKKRCGDIFSLRKITFKRFSDSR